jgi:APA family basic amino acid/polyamine antiporter
MSGNDSAQQTSPFAAKLGLFDSVMIVISGIIGTGIFVNPYLVAQTVRTPFLILAVWICGGGIALAGAFVFAELGTVLPRVGGQYAFFREAFHPLVAFLHGWSLLFIIQSAATATVAIILSEYLARLVRLPSTAVVPIAIGLLLSLCCFHALGIKPGAMLLNAITSAKTLAIAVLVAAAFALDRPSGIDLRPLVPPGLQGLGLASAFFAGLVPVMFAYGGWQNLNFVAEEVKTPLRILPRATVIGVLCVVAVYVSANLAYVHVLSAPALAATKTPAADLASTVVGGRAANFMSGLIVISAFGFLNLALMTAPRVYYAMAADGLFFRSVGRLSSRFRAPTAAILIQGVLASLFALTNTFERLLGYVVFADWIFFALAGAALIVFRRKLPDAPRPRPVPLFPWTPLAFSAAGGGIVLNTFVADTRNALIGTVILLAGIPIFFIWQKSSGVGARSVGPAD